MRYARNTEAGSVLVLALLVTLLILGVGVTAMHLASSGMKVSSNINRRQEALTAAEVGLGRAIQVLNINSNNWNALLGSAGRPCTSTLDDPVDVTTGQGKGVVLCDGNSNSPLANVSIVENATGSMSKAFGLENQNYTIYVKNDATEAAVTGSWIQDNDRRVTVRVEGWGRDALSFFAIEATVTVPTSSNQKDSYDDKGKGGTWSGVGNIGYN